MRVAMVYGGGGGDIVRGVFSGGLISVCGVVTGYAKMPHFSLKNPDEDQT